MRDRRVDCVFCNIAFHPDIVIVTGFGGKPAALHLHLVRCLPGPDDHLTNAPHRLAVRSNDRKGTHVVKNILGGDCLAADPAFGKGNILGD